jgi:AcrR family transcriptional regulator
VSTEGTAFLRARRPEHKRQRYVAILDAARELAVADGVGAVSLAAIADRVGMHKSALLRYFETREEIFLRLAEADWREWADAVAADLDGLGPGADPGRIAEALATSFSDRPLFCQLLVHGPLTLERNVSLDVVRAFKRAAMRAAADVAAALHRALPALTPSASFELLAMTGLIASGMWQMANPPPAIVALHAEPPLTADGDGAGPEVPELPEFPGSVARFVRVYLAGLGVVGPPG